MLTSNSTTEERAAMPVYKAGPRKRAPTHPGAIVKSALYALHVAPYAAAKAMGVTAQALGNIINEKSAITPAMALRLGKYIGNGPELWLAMQRDLDLWHESQALKGELAKIKKADDGDEILPVLKINQARE